MSGKKQSSSEPERYELSESPPYHFTVDRREFMKVFGGGIVILLAADEVPAQQGSGTDPISAWLHIGEDATVTVFTGKVEMGQNIRTSLTQAVAEELRAPIGSVQLVMGDTDLTPYDSGTYGSLTTPTMAPRLRKAAATARELLIDMAAQQWNVDREFIKVADGKVSHQDRSMGFGELTRGQKLTQTVSGAASTTPAKDWTVSGNSIPKVDGRSFVTGSHRFASDWVLPDMWYGKVLRPSSFGANLASLDTSQAEAMESVVVVHDGDFVGVAAPSSNQAELAIGAIRAEWSSTTHPSSGELFDYLKKNPGEEEGWGGSTRTTEGSMNEGLELADQRLEQRYTVAYIAHAPMEPRAAVAQWQDGKLTVWTGTQRPFGVWSQLTEAFHLPEDKVRVIMPDTGSGYGGKHTGETAMEAARLAKAAGRPVKLVWTREEEFAWAYFRPAGVIEVKSGVTRDGKITAWEFHNYNSGPAAIRDVYDIPHRHIEFHPAQSPLRQGSYRALAATANHFARETHIDELAHAIKMDPLAFRQMNSRDERFLAVVKTAAERFGWGEKKSETHRGYGIAAGFEKGSYVATCAEVSIEPGSKKVKIDRLTTAFECGAVVNPAHLKNQVEGCLIMGIGGALFEAIDFQDGKITNGRFSRYRVPRFSDVPVLETILIDRKDIPSAGGGETPIVAIAPAVGNAIFQATGVRLRSLPLVPNGLKSGSQTGFD